MDDLRVTAAGLLDALLDAAELLEQNAHGEAREKLAQAIRLSLALTAIIGLERA